MQASEKIDILRAIIDDPSQSAEDKVGNICTHFRKEMSALMYVPPEWAKGNPLAMLSLRNALKKEFPLEVTGEK